METVIGRGRPASIPTGAYGEILRLLSLGHGYRRIADELAAQGICFCTKSSVERMVKGQGVYKGRQVASSKVDTRPLSGRVTGV